MAQNPVNRASKEAHKWQAMVLERPMAGMAYDRMLGRFKTSTTGRMPGRPENLTSPRHLRGKAISPKAPRP